MSYLVLGSSGLIGRSFCEYLQTLNKSIIKWDIKMCHTFDLRNPNNLNRLHQDIQKADYILFAAYDIGGAKFLESNNIDILSNNIAIVYNVFSVLKMYNKPFIFLSSQMSNLIDNEYGVSKRIGEFFTYAYHGINVRIWNVYGFEKTSIKSHVIPDFVDMALSSSVINMRTNGEEKRQFVYEKDCAEALYILFQNYNIFKDTNVDLANGEWVSIREIANIVQKKIDNTNIVVGTKVDKIQKVREPNLLLMDYWKPKISIEVGIQHIIKTCIDLNKQ